MQDSEFQRNRDDESLRKVLQRAVNRENAPERFEANDQPKDTAIDFIGEIIVGVLHATVPTKTFDPTVWVEQHGDYLYSFAFSRVRNEASRRRYCSGNSSCRDSVLRKFLKRFIGKNLAHGNLKTQSYRSFSQNSKSVDLTSAEADMSEYDYLFERDDEWKGHWNPDLAPIEWNATPEAVLEQTEFRGILTNCLNELPERVANAFTMREMDGFQLQ